MARCLTVLVPLLLLLVGCGSKEPERIAEYELTGEIVRLDPNSKTATIRHQDIKDREGKVWMKAMTMEFPVKDDAEFARLSNGMRIQAALFSRESDMTYWIAGIRSASDSPPPAPPAEPPVDDTP